MVSCRMWMDVVRNMQCLKVAVGPLEPVICGEKLQKTVLQGTYQYTQKDDSEESGPKDQRKEARQKTQSWSARSDEVEGWQIVNVHF